MTKANKELAAIYLSACMDEMRQADKYGDADAKAKAQADYKNYIQKLKTYLEMEFEMFCTDYEKTVSKPIQEIGKIALVFYGQRVNGQQMKYPA